MGGLLVRVPGLHLEDGLADGLSLQYGGPVLAAREGGSTQVSQHVDGQDGRGLARWGATVLNLFEKNVESRLSYFSLYMASHLSCMFITGIGLRLKMLKVSQSGFLCWTKRPKTGCYRE